MKKVLTLIITVVSILGVSCMKEDGGLSDVVLRKDLGVITYVGDDGYAEIVRDKDKAVLRVVENNYPEHAVVVGERVYYEYAVLSSGASTDVLAGSAEAAVYDIQLNKFDYVLTKPILTESFIREKEEIRRDSIGYDGISVTSAWFSDDWMNINFSYYRYETEVRHMVNLVWDDMREVDDSVFLYLRHNAMGEVPGTAHQLMSEAGFCSFRLSDIVPKEPGSIKVKLLWEWYESNGGVKQYSHDMGIFIPSGTEATDELVSNEGERYYAPPINTTAFVR